MNNVLPVLATAGILLWMFNLTPTKEPYKAIVNIATFVGALALTVIKLIN